MLSEHAAKLHISLHTPAWIVPLPCVYLSSKEMWVQVCGNNTSMAYCKTVLSLVLSRRHVRGSVRNCKTGQCHVDYNVPALWPPSYFEDLAHDKLVMCFSGCNLPFCGLIGDIVVTFFENGLLVTPIYVVIEAQIHTNTNTLRRCQMTVMPSRITGQSCVCSTVISDKQHRNIKGPFYRPFVKGIHG